MPSTVALFLLVIRYLILLIVTVLAVDLFFFCSGSAVCGCEVFWPGEGLGLLVATVTGCSVGKSAGGTVVGCGRDGIGVPVGCPTGGSVGTFVGETAGD